MILKKIFKIKRKDGTQIHVEVRGRKGPIVVLFNGIVCHSPSWSAQLEKLPKNHRVVYMDYAGHGKTAAPLSLSGRNHTEVLVDDALLVCQKLKLKAIHAISHSYGSIILFNAYIKKPQLFASIICIGGFTEKPLLKIPLKPHQWLQMLEYIELLQYTQPSFFKALLKGLLTSPLATIVAGLAGGFNLRKTESSIYFHYFNGIDCIDFNFVIPLFKEMMSVKFTQAKNIKVPTLIFAGSKDFFITRRQQQQLAKKIPFTQYVEVFEGSHCLHLEHSPYIENLIEEFIQKH